MTVKQLTKRVKFWRDFMTPLGLIHWEVNVEIVDEPDNEALAGAKAAVTNSSYYDTCWMEFKDDWLHDPETTPEQIDQVIIHEFLHVAMRDLDDAIHDADYTLGEPAKSIYQSRIKHEREGFVDRLARTIYRAAVADVVRS